MPPDAPEPARARGLSRWRTPLVVLPLLAGLVVAMSTGARLLTENREAGPSTDPVRCWDGSEVDTPDDCSLPTGTEGLAWVFPSFDPDDPGCTDDTARAGNERPASWTCRVRVDQRAVVVTYFQLADPAQSLVFQERRFGRPPEEVADEDGVVQRLAWRDVLDGRHVLLAVYPDHPYAVEVTAGGPNARERAFRSVRLRDAAQLRVRPTAD